MSCSGRSCRWAGRHGQTGTARGGGSWRPAGSRDPGGGRLGGRGARSGCCCAGRGVAEADAVNPRLTREWLEYAQARGFVTDPARVRHPRDKPRVEAGVKYVQGNFFAGEVFLDLADARGKMTGWLVTANGRVHGTTRQVPAAGFPPREAPAPRPAPAERYPVPYWAQGKVHVDFPIQVARALYSRPWRHGGARGRARADE